MKGRRKKQLRFREEIFRTLEADNGDVLGRCFVGVVFFDEKSIRFGRRAYEGRRSETEDIGLRVRSETKTIENVREVIKNTPLKKVTKLVNCGNDIVAAIGFDDHLRFASVKDMAFIDDDFDNSNDNNDQECHRRAVKFEQQPIGVCVVSVSVSISQDEEEEEEEEEPLLPKTKVTTKEVPPTANL